MLSHVCRSAPDSFISHPTSLTRPNPSPKIMRLIFTRVCEHWFHNSRLNPCICFHVWWKLWGCGDRSVREKAGTAQLAGSQEPRLPLRRAKYFRVILSSHLQCPGCTIVNQKLKEQNRWEEKGKKTWLSLFSPQRKFYDQSFKSWNYNFSFQDAFLQEIQLPWTWIIRTHPAGGGGGGWWKGGGAVHEFRFPIHS